MEDNSPTSRPEGVTKLNLTAISAAQGTTVDKFVPLEEQDMKVKLNKAEEANK